MLDSAVDVDVE